MSSSFAGLILAWLLALQLASRLAWAEAVPEPQQWGAVTVRVAGGVVHAHGDLDPATVPGGVGLVAVGYAFPHDLHLEAVGGLEGFSRSRQDAQGTGLATVFELISVPARLGVRWEPRWGRLLPSVFAHVGASWLYTGLSYGDGTAGPTGWTPAFSFDVGVGLLADVGLGWALGGSFRYALATTPKLAPIGQVIGALEVRWSS